MNCKLFYESTFSNDLFSDSNINISFVFKNKKKYSEKQQKYLSQIQSNESVTSLINKLDAFPILSIDDEIELVKRAKNGDEDAREKLIVSNIKLVIKIAHEYKNRGLDLSDLVSEGILGLIKGIDKYELGKNAKISSYTAWWIKQSINRAISNNSRVIRIPAQSLSKYYKILKVIESNDNNLTDEEISNFTNLSLRTVKNLRKKIGAVISIDENLPDGNKNPYNDIPTKSTYDIIEENEKINKLYEAISMLSPREQEIINKRYGLSDNNKKTLIEISNDIGRTRERIRQIEKNALIKLRNILESMGINEIN